MAPEEILCSLRGAEKRYGGSRVLGPVDLSVAAGEILGIQGPNGAGKSTLLSLMAGVLRPDGGECVRSRAARENTGFIPQELSLYGALTGLENLKFWGLAAGLPPKAVSARSRWLLEQLGLSDKARQKAAAYSGGMKRRLHLATALMTTPSLLLLDEPTVGADELSAQLILDMLRRLRGQGCGVVLISHRAGELKQVCRRAVTLENGLITREEVFT